MRRGFTLVELAIVLVIIGLLIGGILVAKSMMTTADMVRAVKDLQALQVAVSDFQLTYNCLPGDCAKASAMGFGTSGNGDGYIGDDIVYNNSAEGNIYLWQHLYNAKMMDLTLTSPGVLGIGPQPGVNIPAETGWMKRNSRKNPYTSMGETSGGMHGQIYISEGGFCAWPGWNGCETFQPYYAANQLLTNTIVIGSTTLSTNDNTYHSPAGSVLNSEFAQLIDAKIDDGLPMTGKVRGFYDPGHSWGKTDYGYGSCGDGTANLAQTYKPGYVCFLFIDLDF